VSFEVWRWDAEAGAIEQVALEPLAGAAAEGVGHAAQPGREVGQAVMWKDALDQVDSLTTDAVRRRVGRPRCETVPSSTGTRPSSASQ
jgi:hypothetical protein